MDKLLAILSKLTWPIVVVAIAGGAAFFHFTLDRSALEQKVGEIESTQVEIASLQKRLAEAKKFEQEYEIKKKQIAELNRQLLALQGALPTTINVPELLQDLVKEAKNLEFEVTAISPEAKEESQELYSTLGVNIEFKGIFHQLLVYLDRLAALKRVVNVTNIILARDSNRPDVKLGGVDGLLAELDLGGGLQAFPGIEGKIKLVTYRYKPEAPASQAPATSQAPAAAGAPATPAPGGSK